MRKWRPPTPVGARTKLASALPLTLLTPRCAGMGLPGLLCAKLGAAHVLLTDYEPVVVDQMRRSAERNGVAPACAFLALDWFDHAQQLAPAQRGSFDLLLLADVIYAAAVVGPLVATLRALLRPGAGALPEGGQLVGGLLAWPGVARMPWCCPKGHGVTPRIGVRRGRSACSCPSRRCRPARGAVLACQA